jgi:photosystem II stability/assembly factor-like uncharacterized protein
LTLRTAHWLVLLAALPFPIHGQSTLYAFVSSTKDYVVGGKLPPSGIFLKSPAGGWEHAGFNHPFLFSLDYDATSPGRVYLAAGNGLFQATERGQKWRLLTGSDVTELRDVAVDRNDRGAIYFGYCHGIRVSHDHGATWEELGGSLHRKYTEAIRVDRERASVLLSGGEEGVFRSEDAGKTWKIAGAGGFQITRIEQSPHDPCQWLATTQEGGLFGSHDCGKTFESTGRVGVGANLTDIAFDPSEAKRIAVSGWGTGVAVSEDGGSGWLPRNSGLPALKVTSIVFDPARPGRLYASVNEEGIFVSDDSGKTWSKDGLAGTAITRMRFVPEAASK